MESGKRESNALITYPVLVNNAWKRALIHDIDESLKTFIENSGGTGEVYVLSACW